MRAIVFASLIVAIVASPHALRKDNPDERGEFYQGDIRLPLPKMNKNGLIDEGARWPNGVMAYEFDSSSTFTDAQKAEIMRGMDDYVSQTNGCISFVARTTELNYVSFVNYDSGCWSYVGMLGGKQELNYPDWCIDQYGSILHEMLHAFGFFHQQSATNRDDYVTIMYDNVQSGAEHNFDKYDSTYITDFGYPYDYGSVMHYSGYAFSSNGELTIVTKDPAYQDVIGQRDGFSETDVGKLMAMYNC